MTKRLKKKKVRKYIPPIYWWLLAGTTCLILFIIVSKTLLPGKIKQSLTDKPLKTTESNPQTRNNSTQTCKDADLTAYTVKNSYNNFTVCFPKGWKIENRGTLDYENYIFVVSPNNEHLTFPIKSLIYNPNLSKAIRFQYTDVPFEKAVDNQLIGSNPQFKVNNYRFFSKTPEKSGVEYSYNVYENLENTDVVWFIKSRQRENTYYILSFGYDTTFDKGVVEEGRRILLRLVENFSDAP